MPLMPTAFVVGAASAVETVDPVEVTFGTPTQAFEFDSTSLSGLTALGSPTLENADTSIPDGYYVSKAASAAVAWTGRYVASLTTPFTAITKMVAYAGYNRFNQAGVFVGASAPSGGLLVHALGQPAVTDGEIGYRVTSWTDAVGGGGVEVSAATLAPLGNVQPVWLSMVANSSDDIDLYLSWDGYLWTRRHLNFNPAFTVGCCGLAISCENATTGVAAGYDYLRIWNSALTMPGTG